MKSVRSVDGKIEVEQGSRCTAKRFTPGKKV